MQYAVLISPVYLEAVKHGQIVSIFSRNIKVATMLFLCNANSFATAASYRRSDASLTKLRIYAIIPQGGDSMKRVISRILFLLTAIIFVFDIYFTVVGSIDVKNELDRLAATGAGGVDYWGVGLDVLIMGIILISVVGLILSVVSSMIAQSRVIRMLSFTLCVLFVLMIVSGFCFVYL